MKRYMKLLAAAGATLIAMNSCNDSQKTSGTETAVLENIFSRTSVRKFTSEPVSGEQVETLLKAAMSAPSAMNRQPWRFVVISDRQKLDSMAAKMPYARLDTAPMAIVVCGDLSEGENRFWEHDCSAATENLLLAAHAMGLGAVWTAATDGERAAIVREALDLPSFIHPLCVVPVGHPDGDFTPKDKWDPSKIHYGKW